METSSTDLKRLDFVANSMCDGSGVGKFRAFMTGLAVFIFFLAYVSEAPPRETFLVRVLAAVAAISVLIAWLKPRFAAYGWILVFLVMAVGVFLTNDYSRGVVGWTARISIVAWMLWMVFLFAQKAWRATVVQGNNWKAECERVREWMATLGSPELPSQVLQFNSESFWTGHFTYRLLNTGFCWVVVKFKKGNVRAMIECRVHSVNEVRQFDTGQGQIEISIDGKHISRVKATPEMQARLSSCLATK